MLWKTLLGLGAVAGVGYLIFHKPIRFVGDKAMVGDLILVPIAAGGSTAFGVPPAAGQIVVQVTNTSVVNPQTGQVSPDLVSGPVVGWAMTGSSAYTPITPTGLTAAPNRKDISLIIRGNQVIAQ